MELLFFLFFGDEKCQNCKKQFKNNRVGLSCGLACNLLISQKGDAVRCFTILGLDTNGVGFGCVWFAINLFRKRGTQYRAVLQTVFGPGSGREAEGGGAIRRAG